MSKVQKCPQNAPFCLFPNLQLPQALLPQDLRGCKGQALPDMPHNEPPQGDHVPAMGSTGVNAPNSLSPAPHVLDHLMAEPWVTGRRADAADEI